MAGWSDRSGGAGSGPSALTFIDGADGARWRVQLFEPGEPSSPTVGFAVFTYATAARWSHHRLSDSSHPWWVVVVSRQRGPWRGYERIASRSFQRESDARLFLAGQCARIENGEPIV